MLTTILLTFFLDLSANANPLAPGGSFTSIDLSKNAFSHPGKTISKQQKNEFFTGNSFFKPSWVEAPASTDGRDGLGPTYNAVACAACHPLDGRGKAYVNNKLSLALLFRVHSLSSQSTLQEDPVYGSQINPISLDNVPNEGEPQLAFIAHAETYPDGTKVILKKPTFTFESLHFGPFPAPTFVSPRIGAQLIGLGLLEAIHENDIITKEDSLDINNDGISGKASWVLDLRQNKKMLGRFGWRAEQPTVEQQTAAAFLGDIGITSELFPDQNCPLPQEICAQSISGGTPELDPKILSRVTTYLQYLAVPSARHIDIGDYENGLALFKTIGCAQCHTPSYTTSASAQSVLNNTAIYPFTDLLLHDMGSELADAAATVDVLPFTAELQAQEWRTPPLWGIGLIPTVNGHQQLLHDGRANNVEEAILWHGGEAEQTKIDFKNLNVHERQLLIDFVNKL